MKVRASILLMVALLSKASAAQSWCPPGATWSYDTGGPGLPGQTRFTFIGDTVVDGYQGQRIDRHFQLVQQGNLIEGTTPGFVTRTNGDVVWEWNGSTWDTLFWFNALPGDHWQPFWPYQQDCTNHAWYVLDTSTITATGVPLRSVLAEIRENGVSTGQTMTFTERIGGEGGYIFPGLPPCGGIFECFCTLICYRDDEVNSENDCGLLLGIHEPAYAPSLNVYPNPGTAEISVSWIGRSLRELNLHDAQGRVVLAHTFTGNRTSVDVSFLSSGHYTVHVRTASGERAYAKWTKQ